MDEIADVKEKKLTVDSYIWRMEIDIEKLNFGTEK